MLLTGILHITLIIQLTPTFVPTTSRINRANDGYTTGVNLTETKMVYCVLFKLRIDADAASQKATSFSCQALVMGRIARVHHDPGIKHLNLLLKAGRQAS